MTVPPGNAVNGEGDHPPTDGPNAYVPRVPRTEDELRTDDPLLQSFTGADRKLHGVFGDTIHHNDGRHLDGGIGKDEDLTNALLRLVFPFIAYRMVGGLSDFSNCKLLSGQTSESGDAIRRKPASLRRSSFVESAPRRP